jgi:uncharacterized membrane protein
MVLGQPQPLEKALDQSGLYRSIVQNVVSENAASSSLPLKDPQIQAAAQQAFPPALLEKSTNQVLDGTYAWLQGKTTSPQFTVDLSPAKKQFASSVGSYVQQRLDSLPPCTLANMPSNLNSVNPFTLSCSPPGVTKAAIVEQSKEQVLANTDILNQTLYTPDTLKNDSGQTFTDKLQAIPRAYHALIVSIYLTGVVAILATIGIILLHTSRRAGLRRVAITSFSVGVISALMAFLGSYILRRATDTLTQSSQTTQLVQTKLVVVLHLLANDLRTWWLGYGLMLVAVAVATWVLLRLNKPRKSLITPPTPQPSHTPASPPTMNN